MKGDFLYKQEMLRKGLKSCIIWMVLIIVFTGVIYLLSSWILPSDYKDNFRENQLVREFNVPFYRCPVKIDVEVVGPYNATFYLTQEIYKADKEKHCIVNKTNTKHFSFEGELDDGDYVVIVEKVMDANASQNAYTKDSKVYFHSIDIYLLKPVMNYVLIGACALEFLLIIWLFSIIIRKRNLTKEMILAAMKGNGGNDYHDDIQKDRNSSKHAEYDDLFPSSDGMTSFEKSHLKEYSKDHDSLYGKDYELRNKKGPIQQKPSAHRGAREDSDPRSTARDERRGRGRSERDAFGPSRGGPQRERPERRGARERPSHSRSREMDRKMPGAHYDIEYIPPGAQSKGFKQPRGSRRSYDDDYSRQETGIEYDRDMDDDNDDIDWG